jgi:YebC/PmpR family DNA-binding regulatory protein
VIQNARAANMPKDKVEAAIKRAQGVDASDYAEIIYEGYGPHGAAIVVEAATDNPTRTVANIRSAFNKGGGNMGNTGSVGFMFKRMGVFRLNPAGVDADALELDLIDHGLEEMGESTSEKGEPQLVIRCAFSDFGTLQKALEDRGITPISAESEYIPQTPVPLGEAETEDVLKLVDKLEQDEDVQKVFHNVG